jgi:uncharacterized membrane protein HdeD (DUF308 family)
MTRQEAPWWIAVGVLTTVYTVIVLVVMPAHRNIVVSLALAVGLVVADGWFGHRAGRAASRAKMRHDR